MKKGNKTKKIIKKYVGISVGAVIYAMGLGLFLDPNMLAPGGMAGIAVILNRFVPISTGTLFFILNIPVGIYGIKKFGWKFMVSTIYVVALSSLCTHFLAWIPIITNDLLVAALAGSILQGVGLGIVFKFGATTGGTDIIVKVLRMKHKHMKTGTLFFLTDFVIVAISGIVFRDFNIAIYALITIILCGVSMDFILYGSDEARLLLIVSDKSEEISARVLDELEIGATFLEGKGAYSRVEKKVLMCVVKKTVAPGVEDIIKEVDKDAFLIITNAKEIYGEGYKNILAEKL